MANKKKTLKRFRRFDKMSYKPLSKEVSLLDRVFEKVFGIPPNEALRSKKPEMYTLRSLYYHELYHNFPLSTTTISVLLNKDKDALTRAIKHFETKGDKSKLNKLRAEFFYERAVYYEKKLNHET